MEYLKKVFDTKKLGLKQPFINIYPLVCLHFGAAQCDMRFIKEHIRRIKDDPAGYWIYLGDAGECVTKASKGDVYAQLLSPQGQQELAVNILEPIRGRGLFGIRGNHGQRIYRETGLSFDKNLCHRLGIPYLGVSAMMNLVVNRSSYDLFFHHGGDSGTALTAKISRAEKFSNFVNADGLFTAHSHLAADLQPVVLYELDNQAGKIRTKLRRQYICGAGYDSRSGYAEEKGYNPMLPAYLKVQFDGRIIQGTAQKSQDCQIFRSDGQHEITHEYLAEMNPAELV